MNGYVVTNLGEEASYVTLPWLEMNGYVVTNLGSKSGGILADALKRTLFA